MAEPRTQEMPSDAGVRVRNLLRRRAVLVNLPGGTSLRLGPGEAAEISEQQARSRECARFCRDGVLQVETAKMSIAEPEATAAPTEEALVSEAPIEVSDDIATKSDDEERGERPFGVEDAGAGSSEPPDSKPDSKSTKAGTKPHGKPSGRRKDSAGSKDDEKPPRGRKDKGDDTEL